MKALIVLDDISQVYQTSTMETHALQKVNLKINSGDYLAISGPSGCGKSSLLSILGLLDRPSNGQYKLDDIFVDKLSSDQRAELRNSRMGFVFQSFNLIDDLSVFDNVALPLYYRGDKSDEVKQRVEYCLKQVEMSHRANHHPNQLSGGQQQRVAIARALVGEPALLLVDEPTGNLDSQNGEAIMQLLNQLNENGVTICMVTHEQRFAAMAKQQIHLLDGKILAAEHLQEAV